MKHEVKVVIKNIDTTIKIDPYERTVSGKKVVGEDGKVTVKVATTLLQAIGFAIAEVWAFLCDNGQYKKCRVHIGDIILKEAHVKTLLSPSRADYENGFEAIREYIHGEMAFSSEEAGEQYIRATDVGGVFEKQKKFSVAEVAAQIKERGKAFRFKQKMLKEDAADSVWSPELRERYEGYRNKQIADRKAARLLESKVTK